MKDILITSSVLILAILLMRALFRSTIARRTQYTLWLLVALRLLLPVNLPAIEHNVLSAAEQTETVQNYEALRSVGEIWHAAQGTVEGYERGTLMPETPVVVAEEVAPERFERMQATLAVRNVIEPLWYGGMAAMALWFLAANVRFDRRLRRTRVPLESAESRYPVYLCDDIPSPCLFGLFRPAIYVTSEAAKDENRLRCVIAHEETHARHLDPLWSLVRSVCLVVWWFNPLVWLAAYCSRTDCELACDEGTLARLGESERMSYGRTLLALIPARREKSPLLAATTMAAGKQQMKDRITRIAEHRRPVAVALVLVLALSGAACAATFTGAKQANAEMRPAAAELSETPIEAQTFGGLLEPTSFFGDIAGEYWFLSGAGGWHSALFLNGDGSFTGEFLDSDADVAYYCDFHGRFGDVRKLDDHTYSMRLLELKASQTDGEELWEKDGVRYIGATPYGMENTEEFLVYLPDTPVESLSEEFRSWYDTGFSWSVPYSDTLDTVGLCNAAQQYGWFPAKLIGTDDASRLRAAMDAVYTPNANGDYALLYLWCYPASGEEVVGAEVERQADNFRYYTQRLFDRPDLTLEPASLPWTNADVFELQLPSTGDRLLFWEGENYVRWLDADSSERGFRLVYDDATVAGDLLRDWYKEAVLGE